MPTTSKMGISYPSSSDLVKDGATNMGTIATTVDSKTGLVLLKTYSFSAVSSLSFDANTFTSTFDNYVIWFYTTANSNANFYLRMRSAGTDATSASYDRAGYSATSTTGPVSFGAQGETFGILGALGTGNRCSAVINMYLPYQTQYTHWTCFVDSTNGPSPYLRHDNVTGQYGIVASYDSATLYPSTGTMTGSATVFGVNK